jgi:hypothetical protein
MIPNSYYSIDTMGVFKNEKSGKILPGTLLSSGFISFNAKINGKFKNIGLHATVAKYFVPNPNNLKHIIHINFNKSHNYPHNLKWVNQSECIMHWKTHYKNKNIIYTIKCKCPFCKGFWEYESEFPPVDRIKHLNCAKCKAALRNRSECEYEVTYGA